MLTKLPIVLVTVGCIALGGSWLWPAVVGGRHTWSESDAEELAQAQTDVHSLRSQMGELVKKTGPDSTKSHDERVQSRASAETQSLSDKLAATEARYRGLNANLDAARKTGQQTGTVLQWVGIVAVVVGAAGIVAGRSRHAANPA